MTDKDQSARPSEACKYRNGVPPLCVSYENLAKQYVKELETCKAQLTEANRRLAEAKTAMAEVLRFGMHASACDVVLSVSPDLPPCSCGWIAARDEAIRIRDEQISAEGQDERSME